MVSSEMSALTKIGSEHWTKPNMKLTCGGSITTTSDRIVHGITCHQLNTQNRQYKVNKSYQWISTNSGKRSAGKYKVAIQVLMMKRAKRTFTLSEKDLVFNLWKQGAGFSDIDLV